MKRVIAAALLMLAALPALAERSITDTTGREVTIS
ncbi:hypothetical protein SAMN04489859_107017 [Paracoccus alcaliphilus]|uniref:Uncharacterized protein n=1 Tax=Paracoccus alcaliphilus TaxID=34002 RepID=A0A1H8NUC5_9RHOB|nr:hypothetical protein SAMN04489859_107017 [Paracoccus alcaliphilus]